MSCVLSSRHQSQLCTTSLVGVEFAEDRRIGPLRRERNEESSTHEKVTIDSRYVVWSYVATALRKQVRKVEGGTHLTILECLKKVGNRNRPSIAILELNMKVAAALLLLAAANRLAQGQQALPRRRENPRGQALHRWRENPRGEVAVEQASEQSEGAIIARSRVDSARTRIDSRSRGSVPGTGSRGANGKAAMKGPRSRGGSPPGTKSRGANASGKGKWKGKWKGKGKGKSGYDEYYYASGKGKGGSSKQAKSRGE
jgi:hypothetical protein